MTDNGARALSERIGAVLTEHGGLFFDDAIGKGTGVRNAAAAILANGAVFLPDAAETEAEHERQSVAGTHLFDEGCRYCYAAELDRLRRIEAAARALMATGDAASIRLVVDREAALRAALQPEGSAGT